MWNLTSIWSKAWVKNGTNIDTEMGNTAASQTEKQIKLSAIVSWDSPSVGHDVVEDLLWLKYANPSIVGDDTALSTLHLGKLG